MPLTFVLRKSKAITTNYCTTRYAGALTNFDMMIKGNISIYLGSVSNFYIIANDATRAKLHIGANANIRPNDTISTNGSRFCYLRAIPHDDIGMNTRGYGINIIKISSNFSVDKIRIG